MPSKARSRGWSDPAVIANECGAGDKAAVYLFSADTNQPDDVDGGTPDPITTATVQQDGVNAYTAAFLEDGSYVVAFTCDAATDQPDTNDADVDIHRQGDGFNQCGRNHHA